MIRADKFTSIIRVAFLVAKTNFRLRVENSYLGILWYLLNPLILFLVFILIRKSAVFGIEIPYYPLYLLIGIAGFNFFKNLITEAINAISSNPDYIKSINNLASESLVISSVLQNLFSHIFEIILIIILLIYFQLPVLSILLYLFFLFIFSLLLLGLAFIVSTIGVYIKDLNNIWIIISQLLLLGTPIFYNVSPGTLIYQINLFNPLFYFLEITRDLLIYQKIGNYNHLFVFISVSVVLFILGIFIFQKYKKKFAELL